jgi:hypothetical protein
MLQVFRVARRILSPAGSDFPIRFFFNEIALETWREWGTCGEDLRLLHKFWKQTDMSNATIGLH